MSLRGVWRPELSLWADMDQLGEWVVSIGESLIELLLHTRRGREFTQYICGHTNGGHSYRVQLVQSESTFTFDPCTECKHCLKPMGTAAYQRMVTSYLLSLEEEEDEVDG